MTAAHVPSSRLFARDAVDYDPLRRKLIPCFDDLYRTALDVIGDWHPGRPLRVLDLGAGTGLLSAMILDRHPCVRLELVDASGTMLDQARRRFEGMANVSFVTADIGADDLRGPWDLIASALAIHHIDGDAKRHLFGRVRDALVPGGLFVNAEQVRGPTEKIEARYANRWLRDVRVAGAPNDEIVKASERMEHDRCETVEDQLVWMRQAGLTEVDCPFKSWRFAVLTGSRAL